MRTNCIRLPQIESRRLLSFRDPSVFGRAGVVWLLIVSLTSSPSALADDKPRAGSGTNSTAALLSQPIFSAPPPSVRSLSKESATNAQERLRPVEKSIEERGGAARFLISNRTRPSRMLQLINPFAPSEYSAARVSYWQVPATAPEGSGALPRAFRDERTHEPGAVFAGGRW